MYNSGHVNTAKRITSPVRGGVYWAVRKLRVLERNNARCSKVTDSVHSSFCTCDLPFIAAFHQ